MSDLFSPIEPYQHGLYDTGDGHQVYWERCGNPAGKSALFLHGGPGSGCSVNQRRMFDPDLYNAVLIDQRGSGRSTPLASAVDPLLATNTTPHLISDLEAIREMLGISSWTVVGMSWGTTLALAYAERYPERVQSMFLALVTTTSREEVEWITNGVKRIFPEEWDRFSNAVPESLRHMRLVDAYAIMTTDSNVEARRRACMEWCTWEDAHVSLAPGAQPNSRYMDAEFQLRFATLVMHYWSRDGFLGENELLNNVSLLEGIPAVLMNGRFDVSGPLVTAYRLHQKWASSELIVLDDSGHGGGDMFMPTVLSTLDRFGRL